MDITVVSLLPYAIEELKPGLIPESYRIPEAKNGKPGVLHIKDAKENLYVRDGKTFPITHSAEEVANSVVNDYCLAMIEAGSDAKPALFWVLGKWSPEEIITKFKTELDLARQIQNRWFMKLIRLADDDWEHTKQHRMITDLQRHAARSLGLLTKPWMQNIEPEEFVRCPACSTLVNTQAAICPNCKHITNPVKAKELGISK